MNVNPTLPTAALASDYVKMSGIAVKHLGQARELRNALAGLLELTEDPNVDADIPADALRIANAQAKARTALRNSAL